MFTKKNILITLITLSIIIIGTSVYTYNSDFQFFKQKQSEPINDYIINMSADGKLLFSTTAGDYYNNVEYYNKKFGLGKYNREDHTPIEPKDIQYNPHYTALEKGYPKIHIK